MENLILKDKNLYYIGGVVRDELLGKDSFDTDLTYQGNAIDKFGELKECIKVNEPFGTVRLLVDGKEIDIASTRDEKYDKKGHLPEVFDIGCELKRDVLRRDFTINALAKSTLTGEIIDYTGGVKDIEGKCLRILHDGSFIDDPTRIVRGLKFTVRFGFELDEHTKMLQETYLKNIDYDMSFKRLKKELTETFNLNRQEAYDRFINQKIYKLIGGNEPAEIPDYDIETLVKKYPVDNIWLVYIGWHPDIENLPLTREEQKIIDEYRELISTDIKEDNYSVYKSFEGKSKEAILLYTLTKKSDSGIKYFSLNGNIAVTGEDLKSLGIPPSKEYSKCFDYILKEKLNNPDLTRDEELKLAKQFFK